MKKIFKNITVIVVAIIVPGGIPALLVKMAYSYKTTGKLCIV